MEHTVADERARGLKSWRLRIARAIEVFFFAPALARPLAALRIGLAAVLLWQAWLVRTEVLDLFASDGIVQGQVAGSLGIPWVPRVDLLVDLLSPLGVSEAAGLFGVCGLYVASLVALGLGFRTRIAAVLAWFLHWTLMNTGYMTVYGADNYAHVFLFYLMWVPAGKAWSLDVLRGRVSPAATETARFGLRVLQIHLCLSYLASGLMKAVGIQWWNGEIIWRALSLPLYGQLDMSWLAGWPRLAQAAGIAALVTELGYCVFIWPRRTRRLWIAAVVALHLGIVVFLGLGVFGVIMSMLTVTLFGVSPEPAPESAPAGAQDVALATPEANTTP